MPILSSLSILGAHFSAPMLSNHWYDDSSDAHHTVTLNGSVTQSNEGGGVVAALFDGSGYMNISPDIDLTSVDYTFETFVKFTTTSVGYQAIVCRGNLNGGDVKASLLVLLEANNTLTVYMTTDGNSWNHGLQTTFVPTAGVWHHLAVTINSGVFTLWFDGQSLGSDTISDPTYNVNQSWTIGAYPENGAVGNLQGSLLGTRLIIGTALYTSNFTVPTTLPTAISGTQLLLNFGATAAPTL